MNPITSFGTYHISEQGKQRLESFKLFFKEDALERENNELWFSVTGKYTDIDEELESDSKGSENEEQENENRDTIPEFTSSQYFFTQADTVAQNKVTEQASRQICDIVESLFEGLERTNGKFNTAYLKDLPNEKLEHIANKLANKLCPKGFYNLCHSMLTMNVEDRIMYMNVICSHILLPMISNINGPSRLMCSAMGECAEKFPDDIDTYIFVPMLNIDLKDATIWNTIINSYSPHRKITLLLQFLAVVKELRLWHIPILQSLLCTQTDENTNDKLIELFLQKSSSFSKDKNFGKLVLSFLKLNKDLTDSQANLLWVITAVNETVFKGAIKNILNTMHFSQK